MQAAQAKTPVPFAIFLVTAMVPPQTTQVRLSLQKRG